MRSSQNVQKEKGVWPQQETGGSPGNHEVRRLEEHLRSVRDSCGMS